MRDEPEPWTLPADAATYWHNMYSEAAARLEALEAALEKIARMNGDPWRIARAALDKDARE